MALITCPECGKENVSDSATSCPQCGYNIQAHFNKIKMSEDQKQREIEKQEARDNNKLLQAGKKHKKLLTVLASIAIIIILILSVFRITASNPFKRINTDTKRIELILSYGIPKTDNLYYMWNKSFCGKKGILKVSTWNEGVLFVTWECKMDRDEADAFSEKVKNKLLKSSIKDDRTVNFGYNTIDDIYEIDVYYK